MTVAPLAFAPDQASKFMRDLRRLEAEDARMRPLLRSAMINVHSKAEQRKRARRLAYLCKR